MIEIETTSADAIAELRQAYLDSLLAPFDGMWEAFAGMGRQLEIRSSGQRAGYCSLDDEGQLLQFHVSAPFEPTAATLFATLVARNDVKSAMVSTADPLFLGLCLDVQKQIKVHTYLYADHDHDAVIHEGSAPEFEGATRCPSSLSRPTNWK